MFLLSELVGNDSGFLVNSLITTILENNPLSPSFFASTSSIPYPYYFSSLIIPVSIPLWASQESLSLLSWLVEITSLPQCVSVADFFNRNLLSLLLKTCTPKSFWIFLPKVILKLHLDSKLQVTLAYYLYYKRDFRYCQTLWLVKS